MLKRILYSLLPALTLLSGHAAVQARPAGPSATADSAELSLYPFIRFSADTIHDPAANMAAFYSKLRSLDSLAWISRDSTRMIDPRRVSIVHYGDSHIQGGFMTEVVMRRLHSRFGNAGRGLVIPHRLSGSNEPRDYAIRSAAPQSWAITRVINTKRDLPMGLTGVSLQSPQPENRFLICTYRTEDGPDYSFNKIRVFHGTTAPIFEADRSFSADISGPDILYDFATDIELVRHTDSVELLTYADGMYTQGPLHGFSLENGHHGVLYHAIGVNSACFIHWGRRPEVAEQSAALEPDLLILSMGSNEASGANFNESVFYNEIDRFVAPLRRANPGASVLLTSPPQAWRRGSPNANFKYVSRVLRRYAEDKGLAFLDIYGITGGDGSARHWADHKLMGRDRLHYTVEGYRVQGLLIYNALYKGYDGFGATAR